jgi:hypothetical protein
MGNLRLIKWDDHDQKADTNTSQPSTSHEHTHTVSSGLKSTTKKVDNGTDNNCPSTTEMITALFVVS